MTPPQKKYICGFCARAFTRSEHKQRHERSHTNEKPFQCLYCTSAFVRRDLLQRHCRTVHNIRLVVRPHRDDKKLPDSELAHVMASAKALLQLAPQKTLDDEPALATPPLPPTEPPNGAPATVLYPESDDKLPDWVPALPRHGQHELIQLLLMLRNLEQLYDAEDMRYPVNDLFLAGFVVLTAEPYTVFQDVRADLMRYLRAFSLALPVADFKAGLVYTTLAVVALTVPARDYDADEVASMFINKAWSILVDKLIPNHTSLLLQAEILKNLYVLTYAYVRYFHNDLIVTYLEETSHVIIQNLAALQSPASEEIIRLNMDLFWSIYILVSKYKVNEAPPKFYFWFLDRCVLDNQKLTLILLMKGFSKHVQKLDSPMLNEIVVCTLSNEVNNYITTKDKWLYLLWDSLHNANILIHKSISKSLLAAATPDIFDIFRRKIIINAPAKFKDFLSNYAFKITEPYQWTMLLVMLREFNSSFSFSTLLKDNARSLFQQFGNSLLTFLAEDHSVLSSLLTLHFGFSTSLGIVSFPLIFNAKFLNLKHVTPPFQRSELNVVDATNLNNLVLEWYISVVKILIRLLSNPREIEKAIADNYFLQCLIYLVNEKESGPLTATPEFFLLLFNDLTKICDTWINFNNQEPYLQTFRANLNKFLSDLFVLALNNEHFNISDVYVANESILFKNKRSKSIGSVEMSMSTSRGSISGQPPSIGPLPLPSSAAAKPYNSNYVLITKKEGLSTSPLTLQPITAPVNMSPGATGALPPLQSMTKVQFQPSAMAAPAPTHMFASPSFQTPHQNHYVLPPLYTTMKESQQKHFPGYK